MRKCSSCQQMRGIVTQVKQPDGARRWLCPACYTPEPDQHVDVAGYWSNPSTYGVIASQHGGWKPKPLSAEEKREMEGCGA